MFWLEEAVGGIQGTHCLGSSIYLMSPHGVRAIGRTLRLLCYELPVPIRQQGWQLVIIYVYWYCTGMVLVSGHGVDVRELGVLCWVKSKAYRF